MGVINLDWLNPAAGVIGSILSLFGGNQDRQTQEKINEQNIAFQQQENDLNRSFARDMLFQQDRLNFNSALNAQNFEREMYERTKEDNSMKSMMKQAKEAGVNPFALFDNQGFQGGSTSNSSVGGYQVTPSVPQGVAPRAEMIQGSYQRSFEQFSKMAQSLASLSQMGLNNAQKNQIFELLKPQVELLQKQAETEEEKATALNIQNNLDAFFGFMERDKKFEELSQKVQNLINEGTLTDRKITREEFEIKMQDVEEELRKTEKDIKKKDFQKAEFYVQNMRRDFESMIDLRRAQANSANASANYSSALAKTENENREYVLRINHAIAQINERENAFKDQTFISDMNIAMDQMRQSGINTEILEQAYEKAKKENSIFYWKQFLDMAKDVAIGVGAVGLGTKGARSTGSFRTERSLYEPFKPIY